MGDMIDYTSLQYPGARYNTYNKASQQKQPKLAEVEFVFYVVSSVLTALAKTVSATANNDPTKMITLFIQASMNLVQLIWKPSKEEDDYDSIKEYEVTSKWNGSFKTINDKN